MNRPKIGIFFLAFLLCFSYLALASFVFSVDILNKQQVSQLSDGKLIDAYIDVVIEIEAAKTFYSRGGLTPKEYESYKDLLRYRVWLVMEIQKRKLEVPRLDP